jgi:hypothetical protein
MIGQVFFLETKWGLYEKNPFKGVSLPKKDNRRERYLTKDEAVRLLETLQVRPPYIYPKIPDDFITYKKNFYRILKILPISWFFSLDKPLDVGYSLITYLGGGKHL